MRISEAKEAIKMLYNNTNTVTALVSERGVGKTSAYQQCAEELGIEYLGLYAAALEGPDFMGLPAKDMERGITRYLAPQFLPTQEAIEAGVHQEKGLLILEEINRVPSDTISVLYPLLLESKINGHQMGKGWRIGVTMNPDHLNYLVNALDDAMLDRFVTIVVDPSLEDYLAFSKENNPNKAVLAFLEANPDMLLGINETGSVNEMEKAPTPRGWTKVQEILNTCSLNKDIMNELISGIVGSVAAAAFMGFSNSAQLEIPSAKGILLDYNTYSEKVSQLVKDRQTPILTKLIENIINQLTTEQQVIPNLDAFLKVLPDELAIYFYKALARDREEVFDYMCDNSLYFEYIGDLIIDKISV